MQPLRQQRPARAAPAYPVRRHPGRKYRFEYPWFGSPDLYPDYSAHRGHNVRIIRQLGPDEAQQDVQPMYLVGAGDGWEGCAWADELAPVPWPRMARPGEEERPVGGVGARDIPPADFNRLYVVGEMLARDGWVLRSGGATGSDKAFEASFDRLGGRKQILLPRASYNGNPAPFREIPERAYEVAREYHPAWGKLNPSQKTYMARNAQVAMGEDLETPAAAVVGWTVRDDGFGGTRHCFNVAEGNGIMVLNLARPEFARLPIAALVDEVARHIGAVVRS